MRSGALVTLAAAVCATLTGLAIIATASVETSFVTPLIGVTVVGFIFLLVIGSSRFIGWSTLPLFGAISIEAGAGASPSWIRSLLVGCLWYVAVELAWEAIDRRDGAVHTRDAFLIRIQDVASVVGLALAVGLVAVVAASFAPTRSVALQAVVLLGMVGGLAFLVREFASSDDKRDI